LENFGCLDDNDIWGALKSWQNHSDNILSLLSKMLLERKLFKVRLSVDPIKKADIENIRDSITKTYNTLRSETAYLFSHGVVSNEAYAEGHHINILMRTGELLDIARLPTFQTLRPSAKSSKKTISAGLKMYLC
jgi:predicted ribosome quality control (RQC) complex YloA/Tae2 family protein